MVKSFTQCYMRIPARLIQRQASAAVTSLSFSSSSLSNDDKDGGHQTRNNDNNASPQNVPTIQQQEQEQEQEQEQQQEQPITHNPPNNTVIKQRERPRYDPTAKRPNKLCDPYGQGGKPMTWSEAQQHQATLDRQWKILLDETETESNSSSIETDPTPTALVREFRHADFLQGAQFVEKLAAVALVHNHYPNLSLERRIVQKQWQVVSRVQCSTKVLEGLSTHDFFLAMMMDVEFQRPELQRLVLSEKEAEP